MGYVLLDISSLEKFITIYGGKIRLITCIVACILFYLFLRLGISRQKKVHAGATNIRKKLFTALNEGFEKRNEASRNERIILYLSKKGVNFRLNKAVQATEFLCIKLLVAFVFSLFGLFVGFGYGIGIVIFAMFVGAVFGYFAPSIFFTTLNSDDNNKMLDDIHSIYDTLRVYLKAGTFITEALDECYLRVGNKRLKKAIYELKEGLKNQGSRDYEINAFNCKFDNQYIDIMTNIINQFFKTGSVAALLDDVSEQMLSIDHAINIREKDKLELKIMLKTLLIFTGMLAGIGVCVFYDLQNALAGLF